MIATDRPGSGNTKNIGAVSKLDEVVEGRGRFADLGEEIFDDYWSNYLTKDMANAIGLDKPPYHNLDSYKIYKKEIAKISDQLRENENSSKK